MRIKIANLVISTQGIHFIDKDNKKLPLTKAAEKIFSRFYHYLLDLKLFLLWLIGYIPSHIIRKAFYLLSGLKIGKGSTIHMGARFYQPKNIIIGEGSVLGSHIFLDGRASLKIGNHVDIASEVMIYNSEHDLTDPVMKATELPVEIGDYVFIGPRAIIMPGVKIGAGAVVAGGAVVTKDVPPKIIVGGVPAKKIKPRKIDKLNYKLGRARLFQWKKLSSLFSPLFT